MNILEAIVAEKRKEVARKKLLFSNAYLESSGYTSRTCISAVDSIRSNPVAVIAEFKRKSPSKGDINPGISNTEVVSGYQSADAAAVSILTDYPFFGGSANDLLECRPLLQIPVLRKDFIIDEFQVLESKWMGADLVLLIAACLSTREVQKLTQTAHHLGMQVLLEVHDETELGHVCEAVDLVGINNRNLRNFDVSLDHSIRLAEKLPKEKLRIAESGIHNAEAGAQLLQSGFDGLLIGEYFMKEISPAEKLAGFRTAVNNLIQVK